MGSPTRKKRLISNKEKARKKYSDKDEKAQQGRKSSAVTRKKKLSSDKEKARKKYSDKEEKAQQ